MRDMAMKDAVSHGPALTGDLPGPALGRGLDAYRAAPVRVAGR